MCETCPELTIKMAEQQQWCHSGILITKAGVHYFYVSAKDSLSKIIKIPCYFI